MGYFRFVSGVSSGTVFVLASNVALEALKWFEKNVYQVYFIVV